MSTNLPPQLNSLKKILLLCAALALVAQTSMATGSNQASNDSIFLTTDIMTSVMNITHLQRMWSMSLTMVESPKNILPKEDSTLRLQFNLIQAKQLFHAGNYTDALKMIIQVERSQHATAWMKFKSRMFLRNAYFYLGAFDKSLLYHEKLLAQDVDQHAQTVWPSSHRAFTDLHVGELAQAAAVIQSSLVFANASDNKIWRLSLQNSLGNVYLQMRQPVLARAAFEQSLSLAETLLDSGAISNRCIIVTRGNLGRALQMNGSLESSIPLLKSAVDAIEGNQGGPWSIHYHIRFLIDLSRSYIKTGQGAAADATIKRAGMLIEGFDMHWHRADYFRCLWKLRERSGQMSDALHFADQYFMVLDSAKEVENNLLSKNLKIAYETSQFEEIQREQQQELLVMREKSEREKFIRNAGFFITVILFLVVLIVYRAYSEKLKSEQRLHEKSAKVEEQSTIISKSLEEKDTLLREIHHRVKNNLQIISSLFFLQADKMDDEKAKAVIREAQSRVNVMSLIHQKLYQSQNLNFIEFQPYIQDLGRQIIQTHQRPGLQIDMMIDANDIQQPLDKAVAIGMIINELITNSIKHAFTGRKLGHISIVLKQSGDLIRLQYSDDGQGVSALENLEKRDSLGMKLIRLLTNQMNGAFEFEVSEGFKINLEFDVG